LPQAFQNWCPRFRLLETTPWFVPLSKRSRAGPPISTAVNESAVNELVAKRRNKQQPMRWNRYTVQPFLTVRVHVLNGTLEKAFRAMHRSFRPVVETGLVS
jgi:hypothetical protein